MTIHKIDPEVLRRACMKLTKDSAELEGHSVPESHVRAPAVEKFLAERKTRE